MGILVDGEVVLYGFVGDDLWDAGFVARDVIAALAELGHGADVVVRLNSGGGYTDDGIAIYNALKAHGGKVVVQVDAMAASAASLIAMAGDEIVFAAGALMMIHEPARGTFGTAEEHATSTGQLNRLGDLMAGIYAARSGGDAAVIRAEMRDELWLTGAEALARGFATSIDAADARAVAAFDYRIYAQAPEPLKQAAQTGGWSLAQARAQTRAQSQAQAPQPQETTMTGKTTTPTAQAAPAVPEPGPVDAATAARVRIKAILDSAEAAGKATLARHLAFDTDLEAGAAQAVLAAAGAEAGSEASAATASEQPPQAQPQPVTPDQAQAYRAGRTAAQDLALPAGAGARGRRGEPGQGITARAIYAGRRQSKEQAG